MAFEVPVVPLALLNPDSFPFLAQFCASIHFEASKQDHIIAMPVPMRAPLPYHTCASHRVRHNPDNTQCSGSWLLYITHCPM